MGILAVGEVVCLCLIWQNGKRINERRPALEPSENFYQQQFPCPDRQFSAVGRRPSSSEEYDDSDGPAPMRTSSPPMRGGEA